MNRLVHFEQSRLLSRTSQEGGKAKRAPAAARAGALPLPDLFLLNRTPSTWYTNRPQTNSNGSQKISQQPAARTDY